MKAGALTFALPYRSPLIYSNRTFFMKTTCLSFCLSLFALSASAQNLLVQPFLQDAEPYAIAVAWETADSSAAYVAWGPTDTLGYISVSESEPGMGNSRIHHAHLSGLMPGTRYYYRVVADNVQSAIFDFVSPPLKNAEQAFSLVAMSDMQQDYSNPYVFNEICNEGILGYLHDQGPVDLPAQLAFAMIPGDLVDNGNDYLQWKNTFFNPAENLFSHIPVYPVLGNHENNTPTYFKYFELPLNGTPGYEEHWWYKDYSNLRIIGLNSNSGYTIPEQLDWLEMVLDDACADDDIDFVFAQLHHPHHSELWPEGNSDYTGQVIQKLEDFSTACGKPSVHFYGHTHAYSRGQSLNHNHSMVNVATAGGNIDYWNEYTQTDYPEHIVSQDEYGFVLVEVEAGEQPRFVLKRISRGNVDFPLDNVLRDSFLIKRYNQSPAQPQGIFPAAGMTVSPDCITELGASPYSDPDGDLHGASQWQVATDSTFADPVIDHWRQFENWYKYVDLQAGDDLSDEQIEGLADNSTYFWRVRYRDRSLAWSQWSEPIRFYTGPTNATGNLLINGGAENGIDGWTAAQGVIESILSGECAGNDAHSGNRLFAVGGVCTENAYGEAWQLVDVSAFTQYFANGNAKAIFGGYLSDYQGSDRPEFRLEFLSTSGNLVGATPTYGVNSGEWVKFRKTATLPAACTQIRFVLTGTRQSGVDNDSYFDDMFLQIDTAQCELVISPAHQVANDDAFLRCRPNPAQSALIVEMANWHEPVPFQISDVLGKTVFAGELGSASHTIDVGGWNSGVYYLHTAGPRRMALMFVKQ